MRVGRGRVVPPSVPPLSYHHRVMTDSWDGTGWMSIEEAIAAGVPREVIEAAWRDTDRELGTNRADELIAEHFGPADDVVELEVEPSSSPLEPVHFWIEDTLAPYTDYDWLRDLVAHRRLMRRMRLEPPVP